MVQDVLPIVPHRRRSANALVVSSEGIFRWAKVDIVNATGNVTTSNRTVTAIDRMATIITIDGALSQQRQQMALYQLVLRT